MAREPEQDDEAVQWAGQWAVKRYARVLERLAREEKAEESS